MRSIPIRKYSITLLSLLVLSPLLPAQPPPNKKYPTLLWEITGNGLKKPSYLFGTMHVSSKLVFHLSDSFYLDLRKADIVALELDPQLWQDQLFRYQKMQTNLRFYTQRMPSNLIRERSFQLDKYEERIRAALSDEPTLINGLLYRTYDTRADFEEDTYLDLYIYQTGKKLGKEATGVENYFQTEKLILEAAQDMMKEKKHKPFYNTDGESPYDLEKKTEDAYRRGDLDMLDSLEKLMEPSAAYMEKFLYRRNEIQAHSIDSIVRHHSLFVGVGAAHLPGKRGVIEWLRKKGYILRPVAMQDRDATQKDTIDKIRVPVTLSSYSSEDGGFSVDLPGKLYRRADSRFGDSWQYADMSNGAYYMIGCVRTNASFLGQKEETILKKVDSLLYENIPGKIQKKQAIERDGYKGFEISSKTRRGDIQRYAIFVTPLEVIVFKMSGNGNYAEGKEADQFFSSIRVRERAPAGWTEFGPPQGGFQIRMPQMPSQNENTVTGDGIPRWEYEADDPSTGDAYLVWKKTVQDFTFPEEDTADLALMEESFQLSGWLERPLSRRTGFYKGYPCLDASYLAKDGSFIRIRCLIQGPHDYLLATRSRKKEPSFPGFFDSFSFSPYRYSNFRTYIDSLVDISVTTPAVPDIDAGMRKLLERSSGDDFMGGGSDEDEYGPRRRSALFQNDSTGEAVFVYAETFPKYFYPSDTSEFWENHINEDWAKDMVVRDKKPFRINDSIRGFKYILADSLSSRRLDCRIFLKDDRLYQLISLGDSLEAPRQDSDFIALFYASLRPLGGRGGAQAFSSKLTLFFSDLYSKDSAAAARARQAIPDVYFGSAGVPFLFKAINSLRSDDKEYFSTKAKLINELGYIHDSAVTPEIVTGLKKIYDRAGDSSIFQHAVLKALARQGSQQGYELLKVLLVQDPPIFDESSEYTYLFKNLGDSLALARSLFPDLLQLAAVDDYKDNIRSLLATLVDSGYLHAADYRSYFPQLYFDAKIRWKKQEGRDEQKWQKKEGDKDETNYLVVDSDNSDEAGSDLEDYAVLLMPFYDENNTVPHFFEKLLQSKSPSLRLSTAILLLRHHRPLADSVLYSLANLDQYRSLLLKRLREIHREELFPRNFKTPLSMAASLLVRRKQNTEFEDVQYVDKTLVKFRNHQGYMYFFKYKITKDDDWQIGLSGLQPLDPKEVFCDEEEEDEGFVKLTGKKIVPDTAIRQQFDKQLKRFLLSKRRSAGAFYRDNGGYGESGDGD
jgi:uncharacterized protein YbaP (TraB family)